MNSKKLMLYFLSFIVTTALFGQKAVKENTLKTPQKVMDDFMGLRFGMFIHFGPITLRGTEIGWSRNNEVPQQDYDSLYKEFDPVLFNADAWVKAAKDAGMKYLTITAKHHDGFCLWPTKASDYNISHTPFKKDIVAALAKACKKYQIKFCIYCTVLDWHDPFYPFHDPHKPVYDSSANMPKFIARMKAELKELVTNYHPYMLWFDGNWESAWTQQDGEEVYQYLKQLDPNVIINNRLGKGDHKSLAKGSVGDFATPEQEIGALNMQDPWETCMTICNQWAWKPNDQMKSLKELIQALVKSAAGNGNFLLNVSPMMDGRMEARQVQRIKEMGDWLKINGEAIYQTKGGPYAPNATYATTRKGKKIYLHVFDNKISSLEIPALPGIKINGAHLMNGTAIQFSLSANNKILIQLPKISGNEADTIVVLELNQNAETIPVLPS